MDGRDNQLVEDAAISTGGAVDAASALLTTFVWRFCAKMWRLWIEYSWILMVL